MLDLEEGLESRCRLSSGGGRGCGALHREISLIVRLCDPPRKQDRLLLLTIEEIFVDDLLAARCSVCARDADVANFEIEMRPPAGWAWKALGVLCPRKYRK